MVAGAIDQPVVLSVRDFQMAKEVSAAGEPALLRWSQKHESRAVRGFEYGGPSRTRTYDQGIMSPLL